MEVFMNKTTPHPHFLETLFAFKSDISNIFKDVLGLYELHHIALTHIDNRHQILAFSSTPSLEFNLFNSNLWRYDKTYQSSWYTLSSASPWQSLYEATHYNELYDIKQAKPQYPLGISIAVKLSESHMIYSMASQKNDLSTRELFAHQHESFYKIGQYCTNLLLPLFEQVPGINPHETV